MKITSILTATAGAAALLVAGSAYAQQSEYDPSARHEIDDRSVAEHKPPLWTSGGEVETTAYESGQRGRTIMVLRPDGSPLTAETGVAVPTATAVGVYEPDTQVQVFTNGPVADTPENRARYGQPLSRAGRMTTPAGN